MNHPFGQFFSFIFLKKVAGSVDRTGGLAWGSGDEPLERALVAGGYGIAVAKRSEQRLGSALKNFPCGAIGFAGRIAGINWQGHRKLSGAGFVTIGRKRRIVGGDYVWREFSPASTFHDTASMEVGRALRILAPAHKRLRGLVFACGQAGVGDYDAREAIRVRGKNAQTDQPAPILPEEGYRAEIKRLHKFGNPIDVALIRVVFTPDRFVRPAEPDQVRRDRTVSLGCQDRDQLSIQVDPGRFSVEEQDVRRGAPPFIPIIT